MMGVLGLLDRVAGAACTAALAVAAATLLALAALGALDVIATYALNQPIPSVREASSEMLAVAIFMGMAYAQRRGDHVAVDFVVLRLPPAWQRAGRTLGLLVGLALFGLLTWRAGVLAVASWRDGETAMALLRFPIYPFKAGVCAGALAATLECLRQLLRAFTTEKPAPMTVSAAMESV